MDYDYDQLAEAVFIAISDRIMSSKLVIQGLEKLGSYMHDDNDVDVSAAEEQVDAIWLEEIGRALGGNYTLARTVVGRYNARLQTYVLAHQCDPNAVELIRQKMAVIALEEIKNGLIACK